MLQPLVEKVMKKVKKPLAVAADAAYKTPAITKFLFENDIKSALPYTRPKTKEGLMRKNEYVYDEYYDCYLCPLGQTLSYATTTKEGNVIFGQSMLRKRTTFVIRTKSNKYMRDVKKRLNVSLPMRKKSMVCDGQPYVGLKNCPCRRC